MYKFRVFVYLFYCTFCTQHCEGSFYFYIDISLSLLYFDLYSVTDKQKFKLTGIQ